MDPGRKGVIKAKDLWHILVKWGEKLSPREGIQISYAFYCPHMLFLCQRLNTMFKHLHISLF